MTDSADTVIDESDSVRARFHRTLVERAQRITSVRNDVYTTKYSQLAINFILGVGSLSTLIASMIVNGTTVTVCLTVVGLVLLLAVVVYNFLLRASAPTSFLQYTCIEKERYCFQILSKNRSVFSDGENTVEVDNIQFGLLESPCFTQYRFDFFADMDAYMRKAKDDKEIYYGTLLHDDKRIKCKIIFKNGVPIVGSVGGARVKYFDVNDTGEKFVVPVALKQAAKQLDVPFPKLPGVLLKDARDITKQ